MHLVHCMSCTEYLFTYAIPWLADFAPTLRRTFRVLRIYPIDRYLVNLVLSDTLSLIFSTPLSMQYFLQQGYLAVAPVRSTYIHCLEHEQATYPEYVRFYYVVSVQHCMA